MTAPTTPDSGLAFMTPELKMALRANRTPFDPAIHRIQAWAHLIYEVTSYVCLVVAHVHEKDGQEYVDGYSRIEISMYKGNPHPAWYNYQFVLDDIEEACDMLENANIEAGDKIEMYMALMRQVRPLPLTAGQIVAPPSCVLYAALKVGDHVVKLSDTRQVLLVEALQTDIFGCVHYTLSPVTAQNYTVDWIPGTIFGRVKFMGGDA